MNRSHQFELCRVAYQNARRVGAPAVVVQHLYDDVFFAETKDGAIRTEHAKGCCKWAVKFNLAESWLKAKARAGGAK